MDIVYVGVHQLLFIIACDMLYKVNKLILTAIPIYFSNNNIISIVSTELVGFRDTELTSEPKMIHYHYRENENTLCVQIS